MKKIIASFFSVFIILILTMTVAHYKNLHRNISSNLIRMHIIANSDTIKDQQIKIGIRDRLLEKYSFAAEDTEEEIGYIENHLDEITDDVNIWLKEQGVTYSASACLTEDYFPTREYSGLSLPKGNYTAFKIILGSGKGQNWWCVMFPPLCFADSTVGEIDEKSDQYLKENLSEEEYTLVTKGGTKLKFRLLELINGK